MKRFLTTVAAAATLAGAAMAPAAAQQLRVVEVLTSPARTEVMNRIVADFEADNPGVSVELISIPWDTAFERVLNMALSGQSIDVIEMPDRFISSLATNDWLTDLGPWLEGWEGATDLTDAALGYTRIFGDTAYFLPYGFFVRAMIYNRDLLAQAGFDAPPETMDEFMTMVEAVSQLDGHYGYCLRGARGGFVGWWLMVSAQTGADSWFNEDGTTVFTSPEGIAGIQKILDIYNNGWAPRDGVNWAYNEVVAGFYSRTCAFLDQDPDALTSIRTRLGEDEFGVIPIPLGPKGVMSPPVGMIGWSIPTTSENPELAQAFLERLSSAEVNLEWARFMGVVPAVQVPEDDEFFNAPQFAGFVKQLADDRWQMRPWPAYLPELGEFFDVISVETAQAALLGQLTAEQLAAEWDAFLTPAQQRWMADQQ